MGKDVPHNERFVLFGNFFVTELCVEALGYLLCTAEQNESTGILLSGEFG